MIIRNRNQWIALYGISLRRLQLSINPYNFTRFWQIATCIFPNLSLICNRKEVFIILSLKSNNLINLKIHFNKLRIKLNNLLHTSSISDIELRFYEMKLENYNIIFDNSNLQELSKQESASNGKLSNDINDIIIQNKEILKIQNLSSNSPVYLSNNLFKVTISFDEIDFNSSFNTTFRAILGIAKYLIIGTSDYGERKSIIVHLVASDYETVYQMYNDLIQVITNSNQITGNLSIINPKVLKKNSLLYSLGLIHLNESKIKSITNLVNYIPQILEIA